MKVHIIPETLSFSQIPVLAEKSSRTVLLARHSIRESLVGRKPEESTGLRLTPEGEKLAMDCGRILQAMAKEAFFMASPTVRTRQTAQKIIEGGNFIHKEVKDCQDISDTVLFYDPAIPFRAVQENRAHLLLDEYFRTGNAPGFLSLEYAARKLFHFLTETNFPSSQTILITHDVLIVTLLSGFKVYPFTLEDWCGYLQGAVLFKDAENGQWSMAYAVPDLSKREKFKLFI